MPTARTDSLLDGPGPRSFGLRVAGAASAPPLPRFEPADTPLLPFPQERFTQDTQPHYIYSPREMTRWVRGIFEALRPLETLPVEGLIRIWAHEALRLFQDR